jgi:hypothetical protein
MARQQTVTTLVTDDLTGEALAAGTAQTVQFSLDGAHYEIDLSEDNATSLRNDMAAWTAHARKVTATGGARSRRATSSGSTRGQSMTIREWARSNGHTVNERGRIAAEIVAAYNAAH